MNVVHRLFIAPLILISLASCTKVHHSDPITPTPKKCDKPNECYSFNLEGAPAGECQTGDPSGFKKQWAVYASTDLLKPVSIMYQRVKKRESGALFAVESVEGPIDLTAGKGKVLGCRFGIEKEPSGCGLSAGSIPCAGDVRLVYEYRHCASWTSDGKSCDVPTTAQQVTKRSNSLCGPDIPADKKFEKGFIWLANVMRKEKSFPLLASVIHSRFLPGEIITCKRGPLDLTSSIIDNTGDECVLETSFKLGGKESTVHLEIPVTLSAKRSVKLSRTEIEFAPQSSPKIEVKESGTRVEKNSGNVVAFSIDNQHARIYVENSSNQTSCISYRYLE